MAACSSSGDDGVDDGGGDDGGDELDPCAGPRQRDQRGDVVLGTGYDEFEALTDEIRIIAGPQGGFHLNLNARVRGLDLGSSDDLLDPRNPSTAFAIFSADGGERLDLDECPVRTGYRPDGDFGVLPRGISVLFDIDDAAELEPLFDHPVLLEVDVVDADGHHTSDQRTITVRAPP